MGNIQLPSHECPSFVDSTQQDIAEMKGPDAVVDLLKADAMLLQLVQVDDFAER